MHMHQLTLLPFHAHASYENKFDLSVHTTRINLHFNWTFIFPYTHLGLGHINQQRRSTWKNGSDERKKEKNCILSSTIRKTAEIGPQMRKTERKRRAWLLHQNATHPSDELSPSASRGQSRGFVGDRWSRKTISILILRITFSYPPSTFSPLPRQISPDVALGKNWGNSGAQWLLHFFRFWTLFMVVLIYSLVCYGFFWDRLLNLNNDVISSKSFFRQIRFITAN